MQLKKITYAGHAALFLETDEAVVAVDPWLEANPLCPAELKNPEKLDLIVLTHGHSDHASDTVRLAKKHDAAVAAIYELAMILVREGVPESQVIPMNKGGTTNWQGLTITLTHALHSNSYDTADGPVYAGEACGTVISDGSYSVYHAGDTALFSDMRLIGEQYQPQLAFLPIGDHFTMGPREAAQAVRFLNCETVIPFHYKTFDLLTGTLESFRAACAGQDVKIIGLEPGQSHQIS